MVTFHVMWKYARSFFKRQWTARDYPVRIRHFEGDRNADYGHLKPVPYSAQIVNWWQMGGEGDSPEEALCSLDERLRARLAAGERLARPGTGFPIEYAVAYRIAEHPMLAADFVRRILDLNYDECFISDQSTLWDFHAQTDNTQIYDKILLTYGVDVSDIEPARIAAILERLVSRGVSA